MAPLPLSRDGHSSHYVKESASCYGSVPVIGSVLAPATETADVMLLLLFLPPPPPLLLLLVWERTIVRVMAGRQRSDTFLTLEPSSAVAPNPLPQHCRLILSLRPAVPSADLAWTKRPISFARAGTQDLHCFRRETTPSSVSSPVRLRSGQSSARLGTGAR
jgi:hypothetical protein